MNKKDIPDIIFWTVVCSVMGITMGSALQLHSSTETEIVTSEVADSTFHKDYMTITFDNAKIYNIAYADIDLTVNSKINIQLEKSSFWLWPNENNVWHIINIIKLPDLGDKQ